MCIKITCLVELNPIQLNSSSCFPSSVNNSKCKLAVLPSSASENVTTGITNRNTLPAVAAIFGKRAVTSGGIGALYRIRKKKTKEKKTIKQ